MTSRYKLSNKRILPFRFKELKSGDIFISNDFGEWIILKKNEFKDFVEGNLDLLSKELKNKLLKKYFIKGKDLDDDELDILLASKWTERHKHIFKGPSLHIIVLTLACNHVCKYCHASAKAGGENKYNMSKEKAKKVVDVIFKTTSGDINIEFQGGEPLMNWDVLKYIVEYANKKNKEIKSNLSFTLVTNLTLMDEDRMNFCIDNNIQVATSLDGPKELHDSNRSILGDRSSFDTVVGWLDKFQKKLKNKDDKVGDERMVKFPGGLVTITRESLKYPREIIDTFVEHGLYSFFIRPLNPYGFAEKVWNEIGYTGDEYIEFQNKILSYVEELNNKDDKIEFKDAYTEGVIGFNLSRRQRATFTEELSPFCGAVLQQVVYDWDGKIYTCDEGRMLAASGDYSFQVGKIELNRDPEDIYNEFINSSMTSATLYSSMIDYIPGYDRNPNSNYVGVCPIYSYSKSGNIVSKYKKELRYKVQNNTLGYLLSKNSKNEKKD